MIFCSLNYIVVLDSKAWILVQILFSKSVFLNGIESCCIDLHVRNCLPLIPFYINYAIILCSKEKCIGCENDPKGSHNVIGPWKGEEKFWKFLQMPNFLKLPKLPLTIKKTKTKRTRRATSVKSKPLKSCCLCISSKEKKENYYSPTLGLWTSISAKSFFIYESNKESIKGKKK